MSATFWLWFWLPLTMAFLNVLFSIWLLGRFGMTAQSAPEPRHLPATPGTATAAKPTAKTQVERHQHFNQVRREAVAAALKDFNGRIPTPNPYLSGSAAHATWSSHYDRMMHHQFTLEVARFEADAMERA